MDEMIDIPSIERRKVLNGPPTQIPSGMKYMVDDNGQPVIIMEDRKGKQWLRIQNYFGGGLSIEVDRGDGESFVCEVEAKGDAFTHRVVNFFNSELGNFLEIQHVKGRYFRQLICEREVAIYDEDTGKIYEGSNNRE